MSYSVFYLFVFGFALVQITSVSCIVINFGVWSCGPAYNVSTSTCSRQICFPCVTQQSFSRHPSLIGAVELFLVTLYSVPYFAFSWSTAVCCFLVLLTSLWYFFLIQSQSSLVFIALLFINTFFLVNSELLSCLQLLPCACVNLAHHHDKHPPQRDNEIVPGQYKPTFVSEDLLWYLIL